LGSEVIIRFHNKNFTKKDKLIGLFSASVRRKELVKLRLRYYGAFSRIAGKYAEDLEIGTSDLSHLIQQLIEKYGRDFSKEVLDPSIIILVNGISTRTVDKSTIELKNGDRVSFLYVTSGGS